MKNFKLKKNIFCQKKRLKNSAEKYEISPETNNLFYFLFSTEYLIYFWDFF